MSQLTVGSYGGVNYAAGVIKLLGTRLQTFVYVTDGLLVDTGPSRLGRLLADFFQKQPIQQVVLTHVHEDHSGNAPMLAQRGTAVYLHPSSVAVAQKAARLPFYRYLFWGSRKKFNAAPVGATIATRNKTMQIIETPGHTDDHIVIYDPEEGAVFTGDLFVHPQVRIVMRQENMHQVMASLRRLLQYDFQTLFCAHSGVVENAYPLVQKKLDNLENLLGEVLRWHQKGLTVPEINQKIYPKTPSITHISRREWDSTHIIRSLLEDGPTAT